MRFIVIFNGFVVGGVEMYHEMSSSMLYLFIRVSDIKDVLDVTTTIKPDLFLLEGQTPFGQTIELYNLMRARKGLEHTPVLVLSTTCPSSDIAHHLAEYGIHYLQKTQDQDSLTEVIENICAPLDKLSNQIDA
jgi:DNA-binding response OmpR family regulator